MAAKTVVTRENQGIPGDTRWVPGGTSRVHLWGTRGAIGGHQEGTRGSGGSQIFWGKVSMHIHQG